MIFVCLTQNISSPFLYASRPSRSPVVSLLKPNTHIVFVMSLFFCHGVFAVYLYLHFYCICLCIWNQAIQAIQVYLLCICCVFVFGTMPSRSPVVSLLSPNWLPHAWVSTRTGTKVEKFNSLPTNLNLQSEDFEVISLIVKFYLPTQKLQLNTNKVQHTTSIPIGNNFPKLRTSKSFQLCDLGLPQDRRF